MIAHFVIVYGRWAHSIFIMHSLLVTLLRVFETKLKITWEAKVTERQMYPGGKGPREANLPVRQKSLERKSPREANVPGRQKSQ